MVDGDRFLALRRAREPRAGEWELPGGFCEAFEHPAEAAVREAREELGVDVELGPFLGMYLDRYQYQNEELPVLDCFWLARLRGVTIILDPLEAVEYAWFPIRDAPNLAFGSMRSAIRAALIALFPGV